MNNKPIIIEFAGLPGSGKTTLTKELIKYYTEIGYKCADISYLTKIRSYKLNSLKDLMKFFDFFAFTVKNIASIIQTFLILKPKSIESIKLLFYFFRTISFVKNLKTKKFDLIILEEGIIQSFWGMHIGFNISDKNLIYLKNVLSNLGVIPIFIEVDVITSVNRILNRKQFGRFDKMDEKEKTKYFVQYKNVFLEVYKILKYNNTIKINGENRLKENMKILTKFINEQTESI